VRGQGMPRFLLVDDYAIVRRGLREILGEEYPKACFGEASDGQEALELIESKGWDLILLDISMPGIGGFEVLKEMRRRRLSTPVLILSVHPESEFLARALRAGAGGYVTKQSPPEVLTGAVRKLLRGTVHEPHAGRADGARVGGR